MNGYQKKVDLTLMNLIESGGKIQQTATYPQPQLKKGLLLTANPLKSLEAATRFELVNNGFADRAYFNDLNMI